MYFIIFWPKTQIQISLKKLVWEAHALTNLFNKLKKTLRIQSVFFILKNNLEKSVLNHRKVLQRLFEISLVYFLVDFKLFVFLDDLVYLFLGIPEVDFPFV